MTVKAPPCLYCKGPSRLADSKEIYDRSYGMVYICVNYPECDSYVGCHPDSEVPLGRLANPTLRRLKNRVHKLFDLKWHSGNMNRTDAYKWLADQLGIERKDCHIGMFNEAICEQALEALK